MARKRRDVIKAGAAIGLTSIAGCMGAEDQSTTTTEAPQTTEDQETETETEAGSSEANWPPDRRLIEGFYPSTTGSQYDLILRTYLSEAEEYYPDVDTTAVSGRPAGDGVIMWNEIAEAPPDGSQLCLDRVNTALINQLAHPEANYTLSEFRPLVNTQTVTRDFNLNPRTTPVEEHYDLSWDEIVEFAEENTLNIGFANGHQRLVATLIQQWEPRLNPDNFNLVEVPGGGEARAGFERGDLDGYFGTPTSGMTRFGDFYKSQMILINPEANVGYVEALKQLADETGVTLEDDKLLPNSTFPTEEANKASEVAMDNIMIWLPPSTPDEIYEIHADAMEQTIDDQELNDAMIEMLGDVAHQPRVGSQLEANVQAGVDAMIEDEEVNQMIQDMFDF